MSKFIFITGGVVSSVGKGLTLASLGRLLRCRGYAITMLKLDPFINVDSAQMDPRQQGEIYVTDDGAEGDIDLGYYERFAGVQLNKNSNISTGRIYQTVINQERAGRYGGRTVQVVPHITDEIKESFTRLERPGVDVVLVELGGTVGDIEGLPYIEAFRQFSLERPDGDVFFVHITMVPFLATSKEIKTKPTQHSVQKLREYGIQPDMIICRSEVHIDDAVRAKLAMFCNVPRECVLAERNTDITDYEVPLILHEQHADDLICKRLGLDAAQPDLSRWAAMVNSARQAERTVEIAVAGTHHAKGDVYKSVLEALFHAGVANNVRVRVRTIDSPRLHPETVDELLSGTHGLLVPDGAGRIACDSVMLAIRRAREIGLPYFGIGLGFELAALEYARNVCGAPEAYHAGLVAPDRSYSGLPALITRLGPDGRPVQENGVWRKGLYAVALERGSMLRKAYGDVEFVRERHRCEFELNPDVVAKLAASGMTAGGSNPDSQLVEELEVSAHPWFVAVVYHPEFISRPLRPHPLFTAFVAAAARHGA